MIDHNRKNNNDEYNNYQSIYHPCKRQKRKQAAGSLFFAGDPFASNAGSKKSTAQPRPTVRVQPNGIGPIREPNRNDVLCGRGGRINAHDGNVQFREIVLNHKREYLDKTTKKLDKAHIAARIIHQIRNEMIPPGRFLKEDPATGLWWDIGDVKAIKKAGQALREDAPDLRDGSGDNTKAKKENATTEKKSSPPNKKMAVKSKKTTTSATSSAPRDKKGGKFLNNIMSSMSSKSKQERRDTMKTHNSSSQQQQQHQIPMSGRGVQQNRQHQQQQRNINNKRPQPVSNRQKSWNSTSSSSFGMPFPQQQQESIPEGFQQQAQQQGLFQNAILNSFRNQGMSAEAYQRMAFQQQQQQVPQVFGRGFTEVATEISGVTGVSGVSDLSNFSGLTESTLGGQKSLGGHQKGGQQHQQQQQQNIINSNNNRLQGYNNNMSSQNNNNAAQYQTKIKPLAAQLLGRPVTQYQQYNVAAAAMQNHHQALNNNIMNTNINPNNADRITELTKHFMTNSGLQRSPSFESLRSGSREALAQEDKKVNDIFDTLASYGDRHQKNTRAKMSSLMSVASSMNDTNSVMSDFSWLENNTMKSGNSFFGGGNSLASTGIGSYRGGGLKRSNSFRSAASIGSFPGNASVGTFNSAMQTTTNSMLESIMSDVRSMSDVSESIMALDLASGL